MSKLSRYPCPLLSLLLVGPALAQSVPDAGVLQQQIEQERSRLPVTPRPVSKPDPAAPVPAKDGVKVSVSRFEFSGNRLLSESQLAPAVAGFLNRPLSFTELQAAAAAVAEVYRQYGWLVRAYLPQQELQAGVVRIELVEARFGGARIGQDEPDTALRVAPEHVRRMVEHAQAPGEPIHTPSIDRALLLVGELPGVGLKQGSLVAGHREGETDLQLQLANKAAIGGDVRLDNSGSRSTGRERLSANLSLASPAGIGDLLSASLLHTRGSDYGRLAYLWPVGVAGWSMGGNASTMYYRLVGRDFVALEANGHSHTAGLDANYAWWRSQRGAANVSLAAEHKAFDNRSGGATTTHYAIDLASVGVNANLVDVVGSGGRSSISLNLAHGHVDLDDSPNRQADAATTQTAGRFTRLRYALNRVQNLGDYLYLLANVSGQLASKNLDSAEKFYLGGSSGVRAYPSSEGGGSEGRMVNLELHARLPAAFDLYGFYDWGAVRVNRDNAFDGGASLNRFALKGAGLGLGWSGADGASLRAGWARRIGRNPNATAAGNDQDGTLVRDRVWLSAAYLF